VNHEKGIIYIATGERHVQMAVSSAKSLIKFCPNLPIHIFTDGDVSSFACFDSSTHIPEPHRRSKLDYLTESPYQKTLFLDTDTRICDDISSVFDLLERFEIGMVHDFGRGRRPKQYFGDAPKALAPINSGVILFKKTEPVIKFFNNWRKAFYEKGLNRDEFTLREQLWLSDLKLWVLPPEYNCRPRGHVKVLKSAGITPKILHLYDFKVEAGFKPHYLSLPPLKRIKHFWKYKIRHPLRRHFWGVPY
jgi:hypothetical protein